MRTAEDLLQELLSLDESHRIEAKQGRQIDKSVIQTVCAFANEPGLGGGYILLGIVEDTEDLFARSYKVVGVQHPDKLQSDLASQCATAFNRRVRPKISVEEIQDKTVLVAFIPEASPTEKPIVLNNLGLPRGAYRRVGSTDQEGTEDDLVVLFSGHQVETYDSAIIPDSDLTDIDLKALEDYRRQRQAINPDAEELSWNDDDLLRSLGCAKKDGETLKPTVAGILLFGTSMAIRRCFPMMRIDYIRVPGRQWVENPDHRFDTIEIRAPLFTAIRRATNTVRDELLQSFSLPEGSLAREDEPALPLRVIREAIVNAVMHRSYRIHGAIQIIRYANRLEIRNPGHSIKAEEQLGEPGSETRNPQIAAVLHEVNIAETKGSGIRAMRQLMLENRLIPPNLESSRQPDQFIATFLFHHFLEEADVTWLRQLTNAPISDEDSRALIFVREVGAIDNAAYRTINSTDNLNASTHLRRFRDQKILEMKGKGNKTYYVPGKVFLKSLEAFNTSSLTRENGHQPPSNGHQLDENGHQPDENCHESLVTIPPALKNRLPKEGTKPRQDVIKSLILEILAWKSLGARELAEVLNRREHTRLVRDYLTPMVAQGILSYTIPEMENHPDQKYTVPKQETDPNPDQNP